MVIPLLEDKAFLDNLEDILSVEGIDAVCFGARDYALSLGLNLLYDFNHEKIRSAFEAVVEAANRKESLFWPLSIPARLSSQGNLQTWE